MEQTCTYLQISKLPSSIHTFKLHYTARPENIHTAADYHEEKTGTHELLVRKSSSTFYVKMQGAAMIDAFIPPKGMLVVDRSLHAVTGDIIVAVINGGFTIKRLMKTPGGIYLTPANLKYKTIKVTEQMNFQIWGVVSKIIVDTKGV